MDFWWISGGFLEEIFWTKLSCILYILLAFHRLSDDFVAGFRWTFGGLLVGFWRTLGGLLVDFWWTFGRDLFDEFVLYFVYFISFSYTFGRLCGGL